MVIRSGMGTITCSRWAKAFSISLRLLFFFFGVYILATRKIWPIFGVANSFFFFCFLSFPFSLEQTLISQALILHFKYTGKYRYSLDSRRPYILLLIPYHFSS